MVQAALPITNKKGLHARAAAKFVKCAASFPDTEIYVTAVERDGDKTDAHVQAISVLGLLMLAAEMGSIVHIDAQGAQEAEAVAALKTLVEDKFAEGE